MRIDVSEKFVERMDFPLGCNAAAATPLSRDAAGKNNHELARTMTDKSVIGDITLQLACACLFSGAALRCMAQEESPAPDADSHAAALFRQTLAELKQLQQAALKSDYAYRQVAHLSNNIGPRLTGSAQAQKAVEYVAAELKALGLEVQLEKVMVPHWVRGEETAALVEYPGHGREDDAEDCSYARLGGSVATPAEGLTAEVIVVRDFDDLQSLGREKVAGKIVLFNYHFDKLMAAQSQGRRSLRAGGEISRRCAQRRGKARRRRGV